MKTFFILLFFSKCTFNSYYQLFYMATKDACDYFDVVNRRISFTNCPELYKLYMDELSERGFVYTKTKHIECFFCVEKINSLGDLKILGEKHKKDCVFYQKLKKLEVSKKENFNIPFSNLSAEEKESLGELSFFFYLTFHINIFMQKIFNITKLNHKITFPDLQDIKKEIELLEKEWLSIM